MRAKRKLAELTPLNHLIRVRIYGSDKYDNYFGDVVLPDGGTLTDLLVKLGYGVYWDRRKKRFKWDPEAPYPDSTLAEKFKAE